MTTVLAAKGAESVERVRLEPRRAKPVKWWAAVGVGALAIQAYVFGRWIASGPVRTPAGPDPVPGFMKVTVAVFQFAGPVLMLGVIGWLVIRPWWRERRVSADGRLVLAFMLTMFWQDPIINYFQVWVTYNSSFVNFGSWAGLIPGWLSPNMSRYAEPVWSSPPVYVYGMLLPILVGCALMRRMQRRWPTLGKTGLLLSMYGFFFVFDVALEFCFMRLGMYSFPGAIKGLTLNYGHYYQFPLYEAFFWSLAWTCWAALQYFKNDKGETLGERGIDRIRVGPKGREALRLLAMAGICNVIYLGVYNIPIAITGLYSDSWIKDVTNRSYLMDGLCGDGTQYACAGPAVPIPRPRSVHLGPNGELVTPETAGGNP